MFFSPCIDSKNQYRKFQQKKMQLLNYLFAMQIYILIPLIYPWWWLEHKSTRKNTISFHRTMLYVCQKIFDIFLFYFFFFWNFDSYSINSMFESLLSFLCYFFHRFLLIICFLYRILSTHSWYIPLDASSNCKQSVWNYSMIYLVGLINMICGQRRKKNRFFFIATLHALPMNT